MCRNDGIQDANIHNGLGSYRTTPSTNNLPVQNTYGVLQVVGMVTPFGGNTNYTMQYWTEYDTGKTYFRHFDVLPHVQWYPWRLIY